MTLTLRIDNLNHLSDGGPLEYTVTQTGFEIGRDPGMDWTLPDPNRFISSCHIEIRYENGAYWMYDVSTNGTFVNGSSMRVKSPYQVQQGDRFQIGHYVVVAAIVSSGGAAQPAAPATPVQNTAPSPFGGGDIWSMAGTAPAAPQGFDPMPRSRERLPDFGDQHIPIGGYDAPARPETSDPAPVFGGQPPRAASPFGGEGAGSAFGASPFSAAPTGQTAPVDAASPFGVAAAPPKAPYSAEQARPTATAEASPFAPAVRAGTTGGSSSPFGAPEHTKPPHIPPAQTGLAPQSTTASDARVMAQSVDMTPASETFGAAPVMRRSAPSSAASGANVSDSAILRAICEGAGMSPDALNGADPLSVAHEIGQSLRIVAAELAGLLRARAAAKQMVKSGSRTMVGHDANNPMKFIPTAGEALEVMFGPGRPGYQRGAEAVQSSFNDVKKHQYAVHAAIQPALARLLQDLSPEAIEDKIEGSRFSSKGAKAWELFVERWDAKTHPYENGMLDVFLAYFADAYDDAAKG